MRIAITGASGNVGSALLRRLVAVEGHEVVGIARRTPDDSSKPPFDHVEWVSTDLTEDASIPALTKAFAGVDAVVHLAWGFQPSHDLRYLEQLGVGGTRRVLDAVSAAGVGHLVHMSSVGAYSPKKDDAPVDESWPTHGVQSSPYSRHKAAAERLLDAFEERGSGAIVSRMRPGIVGQGSAGSALLRYGLPAIVPSRAIGWLPVLPLDRRLRIPMVHADDVADAIERVLTSRAQGAFNLSAQPTITTDVIAEVLGAHPIHVPSAAVRVAVSASWHARVQPVDPGWLDLGFAVPLLDTGRAERELGWSPTVDAVTVLRETIDGMKNTRSDSTAVLRPRTVPGQLLNALRRGPVSSRPRP
jgi:nucleoside-diphosphate-sugar epimerase